MLIKIILIYNINYVKFSIFTKPIFTCLPFKIKSEILADSWPHNRDPTP